VQARNNYLYRNYEPHSLIYFVFNCIFNEFGFCTISENGKFIRNSTVKIEKVRKRVLFARFVYSLTANKWDLWDD